MINWSTINIIEPPQDEEIILQNPKTGRVQLVTIDSRQSSLEWAIEWYLTDGYSLWSDVK